MIILRFCCFFSDKKLNRIEQEFETRRLLDAETSRKAFDERMNSLKNSINEKARQELEEKVNLFISPELFSLLDFRSETRNNVT